MFGRRPGFGVAVRRNVDWEEVFACVDWHPETVHRPPRELASRVVSTEPIMAPESWVLRPE
jgi:hypothetical protein